MRYIILCLVILSPSLAKSQPDNWQVIQTTLGRQGTVKDNLLKITFPRTDLIVHLGSVKIEAGLALTSWMGFMRMGSKVMVMGDIVLLDKELPAVEAKLIENGFTITAIHNHLVGEMPAIKYMHIEAMDDAEPLAKHLKEVFALTRTPPPAAAPATPAPLPDWTTVEKILGLSGAKKGNIISFGIPRQEKIMEDGMELPPYLGMSTAINMQKDGDNVATTGDFVLIESEVQSVIKAFAANGITATALHNHMLNESPRMFMVHFWGYGKPEAVTNGLKEALDKTNSKK